MKKLAIFALVLFLPAVSAQANQCSINTQLPANGAPLTSSVIRQNEQAACNDINNLYGMFGGLTPPIGVAFGGTGLTSVGPTGTCLTSNGTNLVYAVCGNTPPTPGSYIVTQTQVILQTQSGVGIVTEQ